MLQLLAGDIGGTKTILRLVQVGGADSRQTLHEQRFVSGDYTDLVPMVKDFLAAAPVTARPRAACLAIAGPVIDNCSQLTNLAWMLSGDRLADELIRQAPGFIGCNGFELPLGLQKPCFSLKKFLVS